MDTVENREPQSPAPESRKLGYHPDLDGFRGVGIILVILAHLSPGMPGPDFWSAYVLVDTFFVMSGYLITTLLLRERETRGRVNFGNFYVRRALRLLPALFLALVLGAIVAATVEGALGRPYWQVAGLVLSYVGNFFDPQSLGFFTQTWSLHVEEQYYILWPVIVIFCVARWPRKRIALVLCVGAAACAAIRFWSYAKGHTSFAFYATPARADGVLLGSALGLMLPEAGERVKGWIASRTAGAIAALVIGLSYISTTPASDATYDGVLFASNLGSVLLVAHLVLAGSRAWLHPFLGFKPFVYAGRISYGLYLYHGFVIAVVFAIRGEQENLGTAMLALAATFALGIASYELIERRALRLKTRFGTMSRAVPAG